MRPLWRPLPGGPAWGGCSRWCDAWRASARRHAARSSRRDVRRHGQCRRLRRRRGIGRGRVGSRTWRGCVVRRGARPRLAQCLIQGVRPLSLKRRCGVWLLRGCDVLGAVLRRLRRTGADAPNGGPARAGCRVLRSKLNWRIRFGPARTGADASSRASQGRRAPRRLSPPFARDPTRQGIGTARASQARASRREARSTAPRGCIARPCHAVADAALVEDEGGVRRVVAELRAEPVTKARTRSVSVGSRPPSPAWRSSDSDFLK